jgi:hypothetical protein
LPGICLDLHAGAVFLVILLQKDLIMRLGLKFRGALRSFVLTRVVTRTPLPVCGFRNLEACLCVCCVSIANSAREEAYIRRCLMRAGKSTGHGFAYRQFRSKFALGMTILTLMALQSAVVRPVGFPVGLPGHCRA